MNDCDRQIEIMATGGGGSIDSPVESKKEEEDVGTSGTRGTIHDPVERPVVPLSERRQQHRIQRSHSHNEPLKSNIRFQKIRKNKISNPGYSSTSHSSSMYSDDVSIVPSHEPSTNHDYASGPIENTNTLHPDELPRSSSESVSSYVDCTPSLYLSEPLKVPTRKMYNKTIILLGKTGVGKVAIAQHIFKNNSELLLELGSLDSVTREPQLFLHDEVLIFKDESQPDKAPTNVRVVIMDTNGLNSPTSHMKHILSSVEQVGHVNAIFFVVKYGRVTIDDCKPFNEIVASFAKIGTDLRNITYLVVTSCEGMDKKARDGVIQLYKDDAMTSIVCSFVKEVIPVGFPNLRSVIPALKEYLMTGIEEDEKTLHKIVGRSDWIYPVPKKVDYYFDSICSLV